MNVGKDSTINTNTQGEITSAPEYNIKSTFRLPITYLDKKDVFLLKQHVSDDLELINSQPNDVSSNKPMYEYLLRPTHAFAADLLPEWNKQYTTNTHFLTDTQDVINEIPNYHNNMTKIQYSFSCDNLKTIWKNVKDDPHFIEKYHYLDWSALNHLNESSVFLQGLSIIHLISPVISFILPILFLIFPFILLKIQGVSISVSAYIQTLKHIAKNHFIGKAILTMNSFSWDKLAYGLFIFGLYVFQIYQNVILCKRFYTNIRRVNHELLQLREYVDYSIYSMDSLLLITSPRQSYQSFNTDVELHRDSLLKLKMELDPITEFKHDFAKINDIGYMLKCYYNVHSLPEFETCLRYSFGFTGYTDNLIGLYENLRNGEISCAKFDTHQSCHIVNQWYPMIMHENPVHNTCNLSKNMIISSPNKSGKTTILKTTAINIIISQQVGCGFYQSATITPYTHIHSYINIPDTSGRDSLFQAESRRCKDIIDTILKYKESPYRHFCIFDELYSGTNPEEAAKAGYAFLQYLHTFKNTNYLLTTHYVSICKKYKNSQHTQNYKMEVVVDNNGNFEYTYKLKKGISKLKGGLRVLKDMDYPSEIINEFDK
jgi:hypothetical protein